MTWAEICADPVLRDLPHRIETNRWGHIVMMPPPGAWHGSYQSQIAALLQKHQRGGRTVTECPVETADGIKGVDVAWASLDRFPGRSRRTDYAVFSLAPEICVEVFSPSNSVAEFNERKRLLFERGALEVWFCDADGRVSFFSPAGPLPKSKVCPKFPALIEV